MRDNHLPNNRAGNGPSLLVPANQFFCVKADVLGVYVSEVRDVPMRRHFQDAHLALL